MTGWRLGYVMGPKEIIKQMLKIHQFVIMCAPTISQYAGLEALKNGDKDILKMKNEYNDRRLYLLSSFEKLGLECYEPEGTFYCFVLIKKPAYLLWNLQKNCYKKKEWWLFQEQRRPVGVCAQASGCGDNHEDCFGAWRIHYP